MTATVDNRRRGLAGSQGPYDMSGWKLVPEEPTRAMAALGRSAAESFVAHWEPGQHADTPVVTIIYRAMLAASPPPPGVGAGVPPTSEIDLLREENAAFQKDFARMAKVERDALSERDSLREEVERLREGLKPFGELFDQNARDHGEEWFPDHGGPMRSALSYPVATAPIRWADFRRAASLLKERDDG